LNGISSARWISSGFSFSADFGHLRKLTFSAMILQPYLHWRERHRGLYTEWAIDLLSIAAAICREETGWLRQKNLCELMLCRSRTLPTSERKSEDLKRGELRWRNRDQSWEILIPSVAFKNANSSFFGSKPFRLILPNLGRLYELIEA
jgi:hypothetical protein